MNGYNKPDKEQHDMINPDINNTSNSMTCQIKAQPYSGSTASRH